MLLNDFSNNVHHAGFPVSSKCSFHSTQPKLPHVAVPVSSSHLVGIVRAIHGIKSGSTLQLLFDCKDEADNHLKTSSMSSRRVSSFVLSAPRSAVEPIWCCSESDLVASISQDLQNDCFIATASFFLAGTSFIVPVVLSVGALMHFYCAWLIARCNDSSGGILATFYNADNFANFSFLVSSKVSQVVLQLPDTPFPLEQQFFSARAFSVLRPTESHSYQFVLVKTSALVSCTAFIDGIAVTSSKSFGATTVTGSGITLTSQSDHAFFMVASG